MGPVTDSSAGHPRTYLDPWSSELLGPSVGSCELLFVFRGDTNSWIPYTVKGSSSQTLTFSKETLQGAAPADNHLPVPEMLNSGAFEAADSRWPLLRPLCLTPRHHSQAFALETQTCCRRCGGLGVGLSLPLLQVLSATARSLQPTGRPGGIWGPPRRGEAL